MQIEANLAYLLAILTLFCGFGAVLIRHFPTAVLLFLVSALSTSALVGLKQNILTGGILLWVIASSASLLLLQVHFLLSKNLRKRQPRRFLLGKSAFILVLFYLASLLAGYFTKAFSSSAKNTSLTLLNDQASSGSLFSILLILALSPFIFVCGLLLVRQHPNLLNKEDN